jgi:hypothetical protein
LVYPCAELSLTSANSASHQDGFDSKQTNNVAENP